MLASCSPAAEIDHSGDHTLDLSWPYDLALRWLIVARRPVHAAKRRRCALEDHVTRKTSSPNAPDAAYGGRFLSS